MLRVLTVYLLLAATPSFAGDSVAWIDTFSGGKDDFTILRKGKFVPIKIYVPLETDDKVIVFTDSASLTLTYYDGHSKKITNKESPYEINSATQPPSITTNIIDWVGKKLHIATSMKTDPTNAVQMRTRGLKNSKDQKLQAPLFKKEGNLLLAGKRKIAIPWFGNSGPYTLTIIEEGKSSPAFKITDIKGKGLNITLVDLDIEDEKKLNVIISNSVENLSFGIETKHQQEFPVSNELVALDKLPQNMKNTVISFWLADSHPKWAFEAYQIISNTDDKYPYSPVVKMALEEGEIFNK